MVQNVSLSKKKSYNTCEQKKITQSSVFDLKQLNKL